MARSPNTRHLTRWVQKETIETLHRLRGQQSSHHNPSEGEVVDQAIALFEAHRKWSCRAVMPQSQVQCQLWEDNHGDQHINFVIGARWPGEDESRVVRGRKEIVDVGFIPEPPVEVITPAPDSYTGEDLPAGLNAGTDSNPDMAHSTDAYDRVMDRVNRHQIAIDGWTAGNTTTQSVTSRNFCVHHRGEFQPPANNPNSELCRDCFLAGHRNGLTCVRCEEQSRQSVVHFAVGDSTSDGTSCEEVHFGYRTFDLSDVTCRPCIEVLRKAGVE